MGPSSPSQKATQRTTAGADVDKIAVPWAAPGDEPDAPPGSTVPRGPSVGPPDGAKHRPGFVPGDLIGIVAGLLLLGFFALQLQEAYLTFFGPERAFQVSAAAMWLNSAILFVVLGLLPWLWVLATRRGGWGGMLDYFGLRDPARPMLQGLGLGLVMLVGLLALGLIISILENAPENPAIGPIQAILTLPLVFAISFSAATGEEILFRGILQKHIGLWPQAIVFGLLHAYQGVYGIVITAAVAVVFGYVIKKRGTLWIPIVAHFTYDFLQLLLLLVSPEVS